MGTAVGIARWKTGWQLVACATLASAGAASGATAPPKDPSAIRAFRAHADTYVSAAQPETNFGASRLLRADAAPQARTFLRFRLRQLPDDIESVTLLLHARTGTRASFDVRRVGEDHWRERQLTYANAPRLSLRYASSKPVRRGAWSAVDVTSFVSGGGDVDLAITTRNRLGITFASRESEQGPRLVVRTTTKKDDKTPQ
jgi:hypothetical protein